MKLQVKETILYLTYKNYIFQNYVRLYSVNLQRRISNIKAYLPGWGSEVQLCKIINTWKHFGRFTRKQRIPHSCPLKTKYWWQSAVAPILAGIHQQSWFRGNLFTPSRKVWEKALMIFAAASDDLVAVLRPHPHPHLLKRTPWLTSLHGFLYS